MTFGLPDPELARLLLRDDTPPPPEMDDERPAPDLPRLAMALALSATVPGLAWMPWRWPGPDGRPD